MLTATRSILATAPVGAVLPAVDIERAERFYRDTLGLEVSRPSGMGGYLTVEAGSGTTLMLYEREATKAEHTVAGFLVEDVESAVRELKERGVVFEEYDLPGLKTVEGIATIGPTKSAWFKDSEGNILSIAHM